MTIGADQRQVGFVAFANFVVAGLKNGDEIVTNGGVIGKIIEVKDTSFIIRSAGKSNIEIGKSAVVGRKSEEGSK